jgi:hypothetical protein
MASCRVVVLACSLVLPVLENKGSNNSFRAEDAGKEEIGYTNCINNWSRRESRICGRTMKISLGG